MEMMNRGMINSMSIVDMVVGTMGKKKTTMVTDMSLSQEAMFRDKALELLQDNDFKFPNFPWINFELIIKRLIIDHKVFNLASAEVYIQAARRRFEDNPDPENCYGYDFMRYGLYYNDHLKMVYLFDVLNSYIKLYFIYFIESSLMISNYSVRTDGLKLDSGNFPIWNNDFFTRDSRYIDEISRHSHILDFDMLRLGKKLLAENEKNRCFEFGVIPITEIGKERGNKNDLEGVKKADWDVNQKNDLFNHSLKLARHPATIDNYPFVRIITDDQRPESWQADARDLCHIVHIIDHQK
jgi:hypothetical protein